MNNLNLSLRLVARPRKGDTMTVIESTLPACLDDYRSAHGPLNGEVVITPIHRDEDNPSPFDVIDVNLDIKAYPKMNSKVGFVCSLGEGSAARDILRLTNTLSADLQILQCSGGIDNGIIFGFDPDRAISARWNGKSGIRATASYVLT